MSEWAAFYLFRGRTREPEAFGELADEVDGEQWLRDGWVLRRYEYSRPEGVYERVAHAVAAASGGPLMLMFIMESDSLHLSAYTPSGHWQGVLPYPSDPPAELLDRFEPEPLPPDMRVGDELAVLVESWCREADLTPDQAAVISLCNSKDNETFSGSRAIDRLLGALRLRTDGKARPA